MFSIRDGYFTALGFDERGPRLRRHRQRGPGLPRRPRSHRGAGDRRPRAAGAGAAAAGNGFLVGTGDVGGVYRAEPAAPKQATYLSRVLDGEYRSRWGLLRWHGTHALAIESRSGNTAKPDATWSGFAALEKPRATSDGGVGQVASPPARYVQYRVTFPAADARLGAVTLAYLPQNQRARITELTAGDSGGAGARLGGLGALGAPATPPAARARAPRHQAALEGGEPRRRRARLPARLPGGERGRLAAAGRARSADQDRLDWNTEGLPDGTYVVRLSASDDRAQPRERALDTTFTSAPILVDNRKPEVVGLAVRYPFVSGRARDDQSPLTALEFAVDGGD